MDFLLTDLPNLLARHGHMIVAFLLLVLLGSGAGLPVPEDIPLLAMGYICYLFERQGGDPIVNLWTLIPAAMVAVLGADCTLYWLGRRWGPAIAGWPVFRRYLTRERLERAQLAFHRHGGKTLFVARFLPGLRAPIFFSAGNFRLPFWKMLAFDGSAAMISVPTLMLAAYLGGGQIEQVKTWTERGQLGLLGVILVAVGFIVAWKVLRRRRLATAK